jgi:glycosyltransferase involved in cell wall biosynthesis
MSKVSFIIPARNEQGNNLVNTVNSINANATGEYEIIVGLDGPSESVLTEIGNLKVIRFPNVVGIKSNLNALAACATGKYLFKLDAHCAIGKGADEILQANMKDNWIVMPRFYILNGKTWEWQDDRHYDYFYISCPFTDPRGFRFKAGGHWPQRTKERDRNVNLQPKSVVSDFAFPEIDETPQIHGSGWFMTKDRFFELGGFPLQDPLGHAQEPLWIALRNQLEGGKVMVNKKCWYAHLHQETRDKGFALGHRNEEVTYNLVANHFMRDPRMMGWLEKQMPMPTWNPDWKEVYQKWLTT